MTIHLPRCPDSTLKPYYPQEMCNLNDKVCLLEGGLTCPYYEEFLVEVMKEEDGDNSVKY